MGHDDVVNEPDQCLRVVIAGCGRVGATLAGLLDSAGHVVSIIDRDERAFTRLPSAYGGSRIQGIVFDHTTLLRSGVETADAFIAVTNGDNSNIVAARTAREHFEVAMVVARIYDPQRASIYERHGVTTIATARWTTDAIMAHLQPGTAHDLTGIGPGVGDVVVLDHDLPEDSGPWEVESFSRQGRWLLAAITRTGQTTVPVPHQLIQGGERIHLAVQRTAVDDVQRFLAGLDDAAAGGSGDRSRGVTA